MVDAIAGIIFIVIFCFVFNAIRKNVTTVSYNGLEGFFKSWGSQLMWAFIITLIIMGVIGKILQAVGIH